jgi:hypothetical protein
MTSPKRKSERTVYGTRPPTPKQLAEKLAAQCRRALGALKSEPPDRDVRNGEIIVHTAGKVTSGHRIGGHFAWDAAFAMPVDVYVIEIYAYSMWGIAWAGKVLVLPNLDVEIVDTFKELPAHVRACVERQA